MSHLRWGGGIVCHWEEEDEPEVECSEKRIGKLTKGGGCGTGEDERGEGLMNKKDGSKEWER